MLKRRFGNDYCFSIPVTRGNDKRPEDFTGKQVNVFLVNDRGIEFPLDFRIEGNVIHATFWGKDQQPGIYSIVVAENAYTRNMYTFDVKDFLELVIESSQEGGEATGEVDIQCDTLEPKNISSGTKGDTGLSAYEEACKHGFSGTEEEWLASLVGAQGKSSYQEWLDAGHVGTPEDFLTSLKGTDGKDFKYEDFTQDQLDSLKGEKGDKGDPGLTGNVNYPTFSINPAMHLILDTEAAGDENRFELSAGKLIINI